MIGALADWAAERAAGGRCVVLVDGRSGAGKTTLAVSLSDRLAQILGRPVQVVSLDDCYPGWDGLAAGAAMVPGMLSPPSMHDSASPDRQGTAPGYRRYDWALGRVAEWVPLDPVAPLVIEGSGSLTGASAQLASLRIWLDAPEQARREAVERRDGPASGWWDGWAAQELAHIAAHDPASLADVRLSPMP